MEIEVPPGWQFRVHHLLNGRWSASLILSKYAKKSVVIKGEGGSKEEALTNLKAEFDRREVR